MCANNYPARRATVDDRNTLRSLWETMRFPVADLDRRLTEFQVVEDADGKIIGAAGFQMADRQARIHSEAFADFGAVDQVRPLLWERFQTLVTNHGVFRLWTQETSPFWKQQGLLPATPDTLKKLPAAWTNENPEWLTLKHKEEETFASLEKELAMFKEAEKQRTARALHQARILKFVATLLAVAFAIFVVIAVVL